MCVCVCVCVCDLVRAVQKVLNLTQVLILSHLYGPHLRRNYDRNLYYFFKF